MSSARLIHSARSSQQYFLQSSSMHAPISDHPRAARSVLRTFSRGVLLTSGVLVVLALELVWMKLLVYGIVLLLS